VDLRPVPHVLVGDEHDLAVEDAPHDPLVGHDVRDEQACPVHLGHIEGELVAPAPVDPTMSVIHQARGSLIAAKTSAGVFGTVNDVALLCSVIASSAAGVSERWCAGSRARSSATRPAQQRPIAVSPTSGRFMIGNLGGSRPGSRVRSPVATHGHLELRDAVFTQARAPWPCCPCP
jgi:hypothetical protein